MSNMIAIVDHPERFLSKSVTLAPATITYRKSIYDMTAAEVETFRLAVWLISTIMDNRGYQYVAGIHGYPQQYCHRIDRLFAVWHRPYVRLMEQAMQAQLPGAYIPYWDWASNRAQLEGVPSIFLDPTWHNPRTGGTEANPLLKQPIVRSGTPPQFTETSRNPGPSSGLARLLPLVIDAQQSPDYLTYTSTLENPHNGLHGWVSGSMGAVAWAAFDPLFWAHHSNVERYFCDWQDANPSIRPAADLESSPVSPFNVTISDIWDYTQLGYRYLPPQTTTLRLTQADFAVARYIASGQPVAEFSLADVPSNFQKAELEFEEVRPPEASFELRIFLNESEASARTPTEGNPYYAGSYYFFGHGQCIGDDHSHCIVPDEAGFQVRPPHHLTPMSVRVNVSEPVRGLLDREEGTARISLVAVDNQGEQIADPGLAFEALRLRAT